MPDSAQPREKHNTSHPFHFNGKFKEQVFSGSAFPPSYSNAAPIFIHFCAACRRPVAGERDMLRQIHQKKLRARHTPPTLLIADARIDTDGKALLQLERD